MRRLIHRIFTLIILTVLPGYLAAQTITLSDDGQIDEGAEDTEVITVTLVPSTTETFADPITPADWSVTNLPGGVTKGTVTRTSATTVTIELSGDRTVDYDSNIDNMTVTIPDTEVDGYTGPDLSSSFGVLFVAVNDAESIAISDDGTNNEGSEHDEEITVTLTGGTFVDPITPSHFTVTNLPTGVTVESVTRTDATHVDIALQGDRTVDYDSDITNTTVTVAADQVDDHTGADLSDSDGVTFTANNDAESISINEEGSDINEGSEDGAVIHVTLSGGTYVSSITSSNFTIANLPEGVTKGTVTRQSSTLVDITLSGNRTKDYDSDITNTTVTVTASEVDDHTGADLSDNTGVTFDANNDDESISIADDGSITEGSEDGEVITVTLSGGTYANPITSGNFTLTNLPDGVTKGTVTRVDATHVEITLSGNRTVDYDSNITNLTVTIPNSEIDDHTGADKTDNSGVTFTATNDAEDITMSDDGSITEGNEDGEVITVTLAGGTFADPITTANFSLSNLPDGVTKGTVTRTDDTHVTIVLNGNRTVDYDANITNLTLTIDEDEVYDHTGSDFTINTGVTFTATDDIESITLSDDGITEENEDGEVITVTLSGGTFDDPIITSNFTLTNLPDGVTKGTVTRVDATHVTITLSGNRTVDYDSDITNLTVTIGPGEIDDHTGSDISANTGVTFTATDDNESITMADDGDITEANEDGEIITVTLTGGTFADPINPDNFTLTNLPFDVQKGAVTRTDATHVTITLNNDRTTDYDSDITDLTLNITNSEIDDHTGADLVVNTGVTFKASNEADAAISGSGEVCENGETYNIRFDLSGGVPPWTIKYKRPDDSVVEEPNILTSPHYMPELQDGIYELVEVKDMNNLVGFVSGSADITVNPLPTPVITSPQLYCENTVGAYYTPLNAGSSYQWKIISGGVFDGDSDRDTVAIRWNWDVDKGYIKVIETDSKGCTDSTDSYEADVKWAPEAPGITGDSEFCEGLSASIECDVTTAYGYLWNTTATSKGIVVTEPGIFTVQRGHSNGCLSKPSDPFEVTKNPKPIATIGIEGEDSICIDDIGTFTVSLFTGTGSYTVEYEGFASATENYPDDFQLTGSLSEPGKIAYTLLSVVDDKGCVGQILNNTDTIVVNELPTITFNPAVTTYFNNDDPVLLEADPSPGTFVGAAVTGGNTFHPQLADTTLPNEVIYFYTHPVTGCTNSDTVEFTVIVTPAEIHAPKAYMYLDTFVYCYDGVQDTLTGNSVYGNPGGYFTGEGIVNIGNDKAIFSPAGAGTGVHEIAYNYTINVDSLIYIWGLDTLFNPIIIDIDTIQVARPAPPLIEVFEVDYTGSMIISGLLDEYCSNGDSVKIELIGEINNVDVFGYEGIEQLVGTGVSGPIEGDYWFNPQKGSVGPRTLSYTFTRNFSQCIIHDEKVITVNPTPLLDFQVMDTCMFVTAGTDSILFNNLSPDSAVIVSWDWDFGDGGSSTEKSPWHDYNSVGTKLIVLEGTNHFGCTDFIQKIVEFQEISRAEFDWTNECFGDTMYFTADDDQGRVISYKWDFADGTVSTDTLTDKPFHKYTTADNYYVTLSVINDFGCKDTTTQRVPVRPTFLINKDNPYFEDFEADQGGWITDADEDSYNSWEFGIPAGTIINDTLAGNIWATSLGGLYSANEKSYVEGPCFDFTEVEKPMIRLKVWAHTENTRDGAVLQTSINDGKTWEVLGSNLDGINWYNSALLTGEPGGQRLGWTGTSQSDWKIAKNLVDHLKGKKFRTRIAFGSDAVASNYEGFAFDEVWVGERTRMVVLEHFTNESSTECTDADEDLNEITDDYPDEVIDIQYHTSFPGADPRNTYFPSGPSSRTLYYGVAAVPYTVMDGVEDFQGFGGEDGAYSWEEEDLLKRILVDPLTNIDVQSSYLLDNTIYIVAETNLIDTSLSSENLTLHIAIVENEGAGFENVLKKMLPDAGGTSLIDLWVNDSVTVYQSWSFNPADFVAVDSLMIIAFVQNEDTKEVYQTDYIPFKEILGTGIFGPEGTPARLNFTLYPNPVSGTCNLKFASELKQEMQLKVYNELGALVEVISLQRGTLLTSFDVSSYPEGVYFVNVTDEAHTMGWQKFIVIR